MNGTPPSKTVEELFAQAHAAQQAGRRDEAKSLYRRVIASDPHVAGAYNNLGSILVQEGDEAAALAAFSAAVSHASDNATFRFNLAGVFEREGKFEDALAQLDAILARDPSNVNAPIAKAPILFELERFDEAWAHYLHRHRLYWSPYPESRRPLPSKLWRGEDVAGKKLLLSYEQGLGEQIMFASFVPQLLARGARLMLECEQRLAPLFARSFPGVQVEPWREPWNPAVKSPDIDMHIPLGDVGYRLGARLTKMPAQRGYLNADGGAVRNFRTRYEAVANGRRIVGVSWHSSGQPFGPFKSLPLEALKPLLSDPRICAVSVQPAVDMEIAARVKLMEGTLHLDSSVNPMKDMDAAAAQIAAMDLVITASNTTAHMAGALGKDVWVLLPKAAGRLWYWFPGKPSPWYPRLRTFVQSRAGQWDDVVAAAVAAL